MIKRVSKFAFAAGLIVGLSTSAVLATKYTLNGEGFGGVLELDCTFGKLRRMKLFPVPEEHKSLFEKEKAIRAAFQATEDENERAKFLKELELISETWGNYIIDQVMNHPEEVTGYILTYNEKMKNQPSSETDESSSSHQRSDVDDFMENHELSIVKEPNLESLVELKEYIKGVYNSTKWMYPKKGKTNQN